MTNDEMMSLKVGDLVLLMAIIAFFLPQTASKLNMALFLQSKRLSQPNDSWFLFSILMILLVNLVFPAIIPNFGALPNDKGRIP